jgi:hypothetical protein
LSVTISRGVVNVVIAIDRSASISTEPTIGLDRA